VTDIAIFISLSIFVKVINYKLNFTDVQAYAFILISTITITIGLFIFGTKVCNQTNSGDVKAAVHSSLKILQSPIGSIHF